MLIFLLRTCGEVRVFRVLTSTGVAIETSVETYRSTALSKILSTAAIRAGVKHLYVMEYFSDFI